MLIQWLHGSSSRLAARSPRQFLPYSTVDRCHLISAIESAGVYQCVIISAPPSPQHSPHTHTQIFITRHLWSFNDGKMAMIIQVICCYTIARPVIRTSIFDGKTNAETFGGSAQAATDCGYRWKLIWYSQRLCFYQLINAMKQYLRESILIWFLGFSQNNSRSIRGVALWLNSIENVLTAFQLTTNHRTTTTTTTTKKQSILLMILRWDAGYSFCWRTPNAVDDNVMQSKAKQTNERTNEKHCNQIEEKKEAITIISEPLNMRKEWKWIKAMEEKSEQKKKFTHKNHCNTNYTILWLVFNCER